jgi:hypothetical protein
MYFHDNPSTPPKSLLSMVGTDEGRGWVGKSDRGSDLKDAGYGSFKQNPPYTLIRSATDLILAPPYRAAPLAAAVLLADGVELHPMDRYAGHEERWPTSSERPFVGLLSVCPLPSPTHTSHPCSVPTLRQKLLQWHRHHHLIGRAISESRKTRRTGRAGDLCA